MQHLADRFFITDEEKPEFVNLYKLTRPDAEVVKAFQASPNAFSLYTNSFLPEKAQYLDREPFGFRLYKQVVGKSAGYQHGQAFFFIVRMQVFQSAQ